MDAAEPGPGGGRATGREAVPVAPHRLDGAERTEAWQRIATAHPRYAKHQNKSDREYPVIRLIPR
ncbi:MAG TPA: hypothetical protein VFV67_18150 [Actinophytocola sp.]|uniref:hypothetical protein n=1 Tax=Actinophytocola sp. TaxID=1872138 RepID=UPI002DB93F38|nr:hypothetical protein [Actinophytocola sp.]HEU5472574.1 hypothetical protein [Actinophytocola sp.]